MENGKRNEPDFTGDVIGKRVRTTERTDGSDGAQEDDSVMILWIMLDKYSTMELSKLLDSWDAPPPPVKVKVIWMYGGMTGVQKGDKLIDQSSLDEPTIVVGQGVRHWSWMQEVGLGDGNGVKT
ncbi:Uncharacterized protein Fot_52217 [Forsythia ovata]|uniref:Uncharacterized protein n=1 Tax=Forsythia ovata TaxID=205694 RepID=A0ABD1PNW2_9LAMI